MKKHLTFFAGLTVFAVGIGLAQTSPTPQGKSQSGATPSAASQSGRDTTSTGQTAAKGTAGRLMGSDQTFAIKAAEGGLAEVKLGTLAKEKAESADVKNFGQQMVDDHSKANDELKPILTSKGISVPETLDAKHQATYDRLSKLSGAEFDRAYMKDMLADHKTDVSEFRKESEKGSDPDLKGFAAKTLPTLEHHLSMAQTTEAAVRGNKTTSNTGDKRTGGSKTSNTNNGSTNSTGTMDRSGSTDSTGTMDRSGSTSGSGSTGTGSTGRPGTGR